MSDPLIQLFQEDPELEQAWKRENEIRVMVEEDAASEDTSSRLKKKRSRVSSRPTAFHHFPNSMGVKSFSKCETEIPIAYIPYSVLGTEIRVTASMQLQSWRRTYGAKDSSKCILCGVNRINRTGPSCNAGHVNPKCRGGSGAAVWCFLFQCAECNQTGKRTENTFDQLRESGRNDKIVLIAHILFDLYCSVEANLDVTFGGLADFVELVYGRHSPASRGGIRDDYVIQLLYQEDVKHPMPPELRNPFLRARSKVEQQYYKTVVGCKAVMASERIEKTSEKHGDGLSTSSKYFIK